MRRVPNTNDVTMLYCKKFSRILIVDAKYLKIKGFSSFGVCRDLVECICNEPQIKEIHRLQQEI